MTVEKQTPKKHPILVDVSTLQYFSVFAFEMIQYSVT